MDLSWLAAAGAAESSSQSLYMQAEQEESGQVGPSLPGDPSAEARPMVVEGPLVGPSLDPASSQRLPSIPSDIAESSLPMGHFQLRPGTIPEAFLENLLPAPGSPDQPGRTGGGGGGGGASEAAGD
mmetsp:Transcript_19707/g.39928  ORF Transcript_19707/g.39928 Transcript_19707/m.39928 type:complete len:126 (+) Transcript_19707:37-414(+)